MERKYLAALLLLLILLTLFLAHPMQSAEQQPQQQIFFAAVRPNSFHLIDAQNSSVFFASFSIESAGARRLNLTLSCARERAPSSFCILRHPAASGFDSAGFKRGFADGLRLFGIDAREISTGSLQNCAGATILIPTGVLPLETPRLLNFSQESGSQFLFAGEQSDFRISAAGQVQKLQNASPEAQMEIYPSNMNANLYEAGYSLALSKIYAANWSSSLQLFPSQHSHNATLLAYAPQNTSGAYCRLIYEAYSQNGTRSGGILQSPHLKKLPSLRGPQQLLAGTPPHYFAWVEPAENSSLALYAIADNFSGSRIRQRVFEGSVREGWLGGFELRNISSPGHYVVSIEDQFSRTYAKSLLLLQDLRISLYSPDGTIYRFNATLDNEPIDAQFATVSIAGSNASMQYPVSDGIFTVAAHPQGEQGEFIVEIAGARKRIPFTQQRNPFLSYVLQFAAPLLFAFILIALILRRPQKKKYSLRIPDFRAQQEPQIRLSREDFLRAFELANAHFGWRNLPLDCSELSVGLRSVCSSKGELAQLSRQGIEEALMQMQKEGSVQGSGGFYCPSRWKLDVQHAANMRVISNVLVQKGCAFKTPRAKDTSIFASCPFERAYVCAYSPSFREPRQKFPKGAKCMLAFSSQAQMRDFSQWLKSGKPNAASLSLMIKNRRLFPCISCELGELL